MSCLVAISLQFLENGEILYCAWCINLINDLTARPLICDFHYQYLTRIISLNNAEICVEI